MQEAERRNCAYQKRKTAQSGEQNGWHDWHYFVPYQEDAAKALEELREEVFRSGVYRKPFGLKKSSAQPQSIDELWQSFAQADDVGGTHSILDIFTVSETPEMGSAYPLPTEEIIKVLGTATPDKNAISKAAQSIDFEPYIERWQAIYLPFYEKGVPSGLLFYGASGD